MIQFVSFFSCIVFNLISMICFSSLRDKKNTKWKFDEMKLERNGCDGERHSSSASFSAWDSWKFAWINVAFWIFLGLQFFSTPQNLRRQENEAIKMNLNLTLIHFSSNTSSDIPKFVFLFVSISTEHKSNKKKQRENCHGFGGDKMKL